MYYFVEWGVPTEGVRFVIEQQFPKQILSEYLLSLEICFKQPNPCQSRLNFFTYVKHGPYLCNIILSACLKI